MKNQKSEAINDTRQPGLAPATCSADAWQQGVASMADNCRSQLEWSLDCIKRGENPEIVFARFTAWLNGVSAGINPPNIKAEPCGSAETSKRS